MEKRRVKKETDLIRKMYKYFKSDKGEIAFLISIYQLFLLFELTGNKAITRIFLVSIGLIIIGLIIGYVSVKKLDTTSPYVMPYTQDYIRKDCLELIAMRNMLMQLEEKEIINSEPRELIDKALEHRLKWLDEPIKY
jgi:hypothetical protein